MCNWSFVSKLLPYKQGQNCQWLKPHSDRFELTIDGSLNNLNTGCGGIIWDSNGHVFSTFVCSSNANTTIMVEIEAL